MKLRESITAPIVGSSGFIELASGSILRRSKTARSLHAVKASDEYIVIEPQNFNGVKVRVFEDAIIEASVTETKTESERRVLHILGSQTHLASLPKIDTSPEVYMKDLGNEATWPYLKDNAWLHNLNRKLKHPNVTIETRKMNDGWHLVLVVNPDW